MTSVTPSNTTANKRWRAPLALVAGLTGLILVGCASRLEFPPMGEPLPLTAKLEIPASIKTLSADYTDSCGHLMQIPIGSRLEEALVEGAFRTFKKVVYEGGGTKDATPDLLVRVDLVNWSFSIDKEYLYDRAPAKLQLHAMARVYNDKGELLRETEIKTARQERVRLEPVQKNCDYIIDPFIQDSVVDFASKVAMDARLASGAQTAPIAARAATPPTAKTLVPVTPGPAASPSAPTPASSTSSSLRFKAMVLDENSNLILEGGERVRVRVDVVNTGATAIQNASASLTGTQSVVGQFPSATLSIPPIQPGETKSLEFVATLPPTVQSQKAELHVAVTEGGGAAAPSQTLALTIQPTGIQSDDVDQIPAPVAHFRRPHTYLLSIGIGSYRDTQLLPRKYASLDAEMVANYFQSLGGVPASNVRLLQDWKALRPDIDEALLDWLPPRMNKDAVVIVYFAGQAIVTPTGEVLLVPYEGSPSSTTRLYPLKDLESALARLKAKQTILLFDGMVSRLHSDPKAKSVAPRWETGGATVRVIGGEGYAKGIEDDKHRHGLFTYYLLRGLRGDADTNRDGEVTLGELAAYVSQKVSWASKTHFNSDQHPHVWPVLKSGDKSSSLVLTKLAAITGSETP
ncbi:conserved exported protein of unknown function [Nitrospira moscoviensis]|uniref:Peptidase C14 caspase domain-containing protein n=1 Tax=Nitrospira moscoviensis TaxID=42253 RepID=A0A0K2GGK9_NITMO|nr:conserved exported protein of unknown function [Nitrospira moscoviensis]